nr:putative ribonuclease H-like domain-containing protein [Tanacetum cinerariifolium]
MESLIVESKFPIVSSPIPTIFIDTSLETSSSSRLILKEVISQEETPSLDNALTLSNRFKDTIVVESHLSNMESSIPASLTPTFKIHKDHPKSQIIGPLDTLVQTRHKSTEMEEHSFIAKIRQKITPDLLQFYLFLCFLSQEEPKKIVDALKNPSWVEAIQEELLQFKIQNVWILVDCPKGIRPIGTKWVLKNKKDEWGIVIRNKARVVTQGHTQEEGIAYEEVFELVTRIEAIRLFLANASFMGFTLYQMDVKSAFLYGIIDEEVYVMQPLGFQDPKFPDRVCKVDKAMYGLHQAPRAWYGILSKYLLENGFQRGTINHTLFIRKHRGDFLLVQVLDIMFAVCACARHQVTPKECHLHAVKRIFRYLKEYVAAASGCGQGLWIQNQMLDYGKIDDLDTMSLDDVYNHLKVYEPEVQKKSETYSQNMAFISSLNTSSGKGKVYTDSVQTGSTHVSTASIDVTAASISHDTLCAYIASQSNGFGRRLDPKALMALDGIGCDWSYMANEEENHALVADEEALTEFALMAKSSSSSENEDIMLYPPPAQVYSPPKKDMSWTGLPEFADDTVTDYSRPTPCIDSS